MTYKINCYNMGTHKITSTDICIVGDKVTDIDRLGFEWTGDVLEVVDHSFETKAKGLIKQCLDGLLTVYDKMCGG